MNIASHQSSTLVFLFLMMILWFDGIQSVDADMIDAVNDAVGNFVSIAPFQVISFAASLETCIDEGTSNNINSMADFIMQESYFPSLDLSVDPSYLSVLKLSDDPSISSTDLSDFRDYLNGMINIGSCLVKVTWSTATAGSFETYAIVDSNDVVQYETMNAFVLTDIPQSDDSNTGRRQLNHRCGQYQINDETSDVYINLVFRYTVLTFNCRAHAECLKDQLIDCSSTHDAIAHAFPFQADGVDDSKIAGMCCLAECQFGYASGFKKVKISIDKVSVEIEGIIGTGGTLSKTARACCEDHCTDEPTASPSATTPTAAPSTTTTPPAAPTSIASTGFPTIPTFTNSDYPTQ